MGYAERINEKLASFIHSSTIEQLCYSVIWRTGWTFDLNMDLTKLTCKNGKYYYIHKLSYDMIPLTT
jgi:hypothetical protein